MLCQLRQCLIPSAKHEARCLAWASTHLYNVTYCPRRDTEKGGKITCHGALHLRLVSVRLLRRRGR